MLASTRRRASAVSSRCHGVGEDDPSVAGRDPGAAAAGPATRSRSEEARHLVLGAAGRGQDDAGGELPCGAQDPRTLVSDRRRGRRRRHVLLLSRPSRAAWLAAAPVADARVPQRRRAVWSALLP